MEKTIVVTPKFRMAFPHLLQPTEDLSGKMQWSVTALFPVDADLTSLKKAAEAACEKKWGSDRNKWPKMDSPFSDGNTKGKTDSNGNFQIYNGYEDKVVVTFKRNVKTHTGADNSAPAAVIANPNIEATEKDIYAGRWAKAVVNAFAWSFAGKNGVSFGLNHIQILDHDTPIGGAPRDATAYFDNEESGEQTAQKSFLD